MPIEPTASGTVLEFSKEVESMLGWRVGQASLERTEEMVWEYILRQFPLLGRAPKSHEILDWYGYHTAPHSRSGTEITKPT